MAAAKQKAVVQRKTNRTRSRKLNKQNRTITAPPVERHVGRHGVYTSLRIGLRPAICNKIKILRPFSSL
jgi:limonene-1,2-epoxide hydrolase